MWKGLHGEYCKPNSGLCNSCELLNKNGNLQGVLQQIKTGIHENTHLRYHSIGGLVTLARRKTGEIKALRLKGLNNAWKLAGKVVAVDDIKRWVMAIRSGKVKHIDCHVRINLARKSGIQNLLNLYYWAARRVYHPRNYTDKNNL